ncbi:MAG: hypothetical protein AB2A00_04610 [Myxococcota bacterium]
MLVPVCRFTHVTRHLVVGVSLWCVPAAVTAQAAEPPPATTEAPAQVQVEERPEVVVQEDASVEVLLQRATQAYDGLDYEVALAHAAAALRKPAITDEQRVRAYVILAGSSAVMGQTLEAERAYRLLLRLQPGFTMPDSTPPKILAAWRVVWAEEEEIRRTVREAEHQRLIQSIRLDVQAPERHRGGEPLEVRVHVVDPYRGIQALTLAYRTRGQGAYSTLPFEKRGDSYVARFTAAQTSSELGLKLQYAVIARGHGGEVLATQGTEAKPRVVAVTPGFEPGPPMYKQPWFRPVAAAAGAGLFTVSGLILVGVVGSAGGAALAAYLLTRGEAVPRTPLGSHRF